MMRNKYLHALGRLSAGITQQRIDREAGNLGKATEFVHRWRNLPAYPCGDGWLRDTKLCCQPNLRFAGIFKPLFEYQHASKYRLFLFSVNRPYLLRCWAHFLND